MDPTDPLDVSTDIGDDGAVTTPDQNPSNGLSATQLLSQLIGTAGQVATAAQLAPAIAAQQPATTAPQGTVVIAGTAYSTTTLLLIGAGVLAFALVLRK